jgi:hypothetical protein
MKTDALVCTANQNLSRAVSEVQIIYEATGEDTRADFIRPNYLIDR